MHFFVDNKEQENYKYCIRIFLYSIQIEGKHTFRKSWNALFEWPGQFLFSVLVTNLRALYIPGKFFTIELHH